VKFSGTYYDKYKEVVMPTTISTSSGISVTRLSPVEIRTDWDKKAKENVLKEVGVKAEMIDAQKGFSEKEIEFWVYSDGTAKNIQRAIQNDVKKHAVLYIYALQSINSELTNIDVIRNNIDSMLAVAKQANLEDLDVKETQIKAAMDYLNEREPGSFEKVSSGNKQLLAEFLVNRCDDCRKKILISYKNFLFAANTGPESKSLMVFATKILGDQKLVIGIDKIQDFYLKPENYGKDMPIDDSFLNSIALSMN